MTLQPIEGPDAPPAVLGLPAAFLLAYTGHTRKAYLADLRDFAGWCASHDVEPLAARRAHVDLYARQLEQAGRSPATVARRLACLSRFYGYAVDEGLLPTSPMAHVRRPRLGADSPTLGLTRDQLAALLVAAAAAGPRDLALVCLLALNGLRIGELVRADVNDLGHERGHRVLRLTRKGGARVDMPLAARTAAAVAEHVGDRAAGPLVLGNDAGRLTRDRAARALRRLARRAGLPPRISPHSLRHTFVTLALDAGASLRDVQDGAGHADPRTTRRYDRGRHNLDRHVTYAVAAHLAAGPASAPFLP